MDGKSASLNGYPEAKFSELMVRYSGHLRSVNEESAKDPEPPPARKVPAEVETASSRIFEQYGVTVPFEAWTIFRAEQEQKKCCGCQGLPCQKTTWKGRVPKIKYDAAMQQVVIRYANCKYEHARQVQAEIERRSIKSKIPPQYLGKKFEDYQVDKNNELAVRAAKKLIELPKQGVYFYGAVGTGKTLLTAIIAQEIVRQGRQVIFATVPTISMELRGCFKERTAKSESDILETLYTVPTLILDDIGLEKPTRFVCSTLCNLFNERYNAELQTIMTSNYKLSELEQIFNHPTDGGETMDGSRIYDRCKKMCPPIELKGSSRR